MDRFIAAGYVDTFRHIHGDEAGRYTWWSYRRRARLTNAGWRLDYFFISAELLPALRDAWIDAHVLGSDHCPVGITLELDDNAGASLQSGTEAETGAETANRNTRARARKNPAGAG